MAKLPSPQKIWRIWLGSQSPRRPILRWSATDKLGLLMVCLLVAIFSSYKLLAVPDLKPGDIAQVNVIAPRDAKVIDTKDLKEKKQSQLFFGFHFSFFFFFICITPQNLSEKKDRFR